MLLKRYLACILTIALSFGCFGGINIFAAEDYFQPDTLIELEDGSVKSNIFKVKSPYASGGEYLVSRASNITDALKKYDEMSYIIDIAEGVDYNLFLRAYTPANKTLFYRWDNSEWKSFTVPASSDFAWVKINTFGLSKGKHKFQLCHGQVDVWYDCIYLTKNLEFVPETPEGVKPMPEKIVTTTFVHNQEGTLLVGENGAVIEAENTSFSESFYIESETEASGGKYITAVNTSTLPDSPNAGDAGDIEFSITADVDATFYVWARFHMQSANNSFYSAVDDSKWIQKYMTYDTYPTYGWEMPLTNTSTSIPVTLKKGESATIKFSKRHNGCRIDQFVVTPKATFYPKGAISEISTEIETLVPITELPPYNPPKGVHPRLGFTDKDIPELIKKYNHPENAVTKAKLENYADKDTVVGATYNITTLYEISAKAYKYALFKDKEMGRKAIDTALTLTNINTWTGYPTREKGFVILTVSSVYDWCYDLLTEEEKTLLMEIAIGCASGMEIGWPPNGHGSRTFTGHGAEAQLLRDQLSFAIATYDERPDFWNYIGGRFYHEYVAEREWETKGGMHHAGVAYGIYRHVYSMWACAFIMGMGLPEPYNAYEAGMFEIGNNIYPRRPDGSFFSRGDTYTHNLMSYNLPGEEHLVLSLHLSKDPYIKDELIRVRRNGGKAGIVEGDPSEMGPAFWMIFNEPEVEEKSISNLPLSKYFPSPAGIMYAKTGWDAGVKANTVAAELAIGYEWAPPDGGHNHRDAGSFQIYYKGPLATDSGYYHHFGTDHHTNYTVQTIAHNTMLVYDPDEPAENFEGNINDGGQEHKGLKGNNEATFKNMIDYADYYRRSTVLAQEIDPENPIEPDYTYIKGDITNAYSDKMKEFKRSFMFLNFKEEKVPAALIVFDKVMVSKPNLKRTWLLHGQSDPVLSGKRSVWLSNPYENEYGEKYSGKMVVDHLLPEKPQIDVIGGEEEGWFNINGVNFPYEQADYDGNEQKTYRMEISEKGKETSYFLNCIQVTDEGNNSYLKSEMIDTDNFYGVKISDRAVLFSKSGEKLLADFELTSDGRNFKYTICDIDKGNWKLNLDGEEVTVVATAEGGVLSFETSAKTIKAERISEEVEVVEKNIQIKDDKDIYIKIGSTLMGLPVKAKLVNGKVMVPVDALINRMEIKKETGFLREIFKDESQKIEVLIQEGSKNLVKNGVSVEMTNAPYYENGYLMIELRPFAESFNFNVYWDNEFSNVYLFANKVVFVETAEGYANIKEVTNDGGTVADGFDVNTVIDNSLTTSWANQGEGRYIDFELHEKTILENIEIIFNPSSKRSPKFEVQISEDGKNYTTVYSGNGSPDADGVKWEVFKFDPQMLVETKYVRYIGNGSDKSLWNGVKEIRFKIGEPLIRWEESDKYAKVSYTTGDNGEIADEFLSPNLADNNGRTLWAAQGKGRYVDLTLENKESLIGIEIIFNPEKKRSPKFEVQVSEDGKNFTTVYQGTGNPEIAENTWESFDFGKTVNAKVVRYIGLGSNLSLWNGVKEVRLKKAQ